ncbi:hypothetical protein FRC18_001634 [Serendipita sp. 400]|nr:hypothetical protein FRC18_001634 [Serendipita sp. 400]
MIDVPDDVLTIIFQIYASSSHLNQSPAKLLVVCKRWASIASSMPSLWSTININIYSKDTIPSMQTSKGLEKYLQRGESGNIAVPLSGTVQWRPGGANVHGDGGVIGFQGCILCRSAGAQLGWLFDTLFHGAAEAPRNTPSPRALRWTNLSILLSGLMVPQCTYVPPHYQVWATASFGDPRKFDLLNLQSLSLHNTPDMLTCFNLPDMRILDVQQPQHSLQLSGMICEQSMAVVPSDLLWHVCDNIKSLEMTTTNFEFPSYIAFPNLTTITFRHNVTSGTLESLGHIFNQDRPLQTLRLFELEHATISERLMGAGNLHFLTLQTYPPKMHYWGGSVNDEIAVLLELEDLVSQRGGRLITHSAPKRSGEEGRTSLDRRNSWLRKTFKDVRFKLLPQK